MKPHVCPWWIGYFLASPIRKIWQDPCEILKPYISPGMTVVEPGPGMGFFTLELARLVGPGGRIVAVDIQEKMLSVLKKKAAKAGLASRIDARLIAGPGLGVEDLKGSVDFLLAFAMVHELPDQGLFFREAAGVLKPGCRLLFSEPANHVSEEDFGRSLGTAENAGLRLERKPIISRCLSAVLVKG